MKLSKSLVMAALVAGSLAAGDFSARAQSTTPAAPPAVGQNGPGVRGRLTIEQLTKELTLTDGQKPKVKAVLDDQQQKSQALRTDTSLTPADRRTKTKAIRDEATAKLKEILTADQFAKYQKLLPGGRNLPGTPVTPPATPPAAGN
jgi:hypothetical protein